MKGAWHLSVAPLPCSPIPLFPYSPIPLFPYSPIPLFPYMIIHAYQNTQELARL